MRDFLNITKALADENRLRAIALLKEQELCLCQNVEGLGLATSTVSTHMSILHQVRLVEPRKDGPWAYFDSPIRTQRPQSARLSTWRSKDWNLIGRESPTRNS